MRTNCVEHYSISVCFVRCFIIKVIFFLKVPYYATSTLPVFSNNNMCILYFFCSEKWGLKQAALCDIIKAEVFAGGSEHVVFWSFCSLKRKIKKSENGSDIGPLSDIDYVAYITFYALVIQ